MTRRPLVLAALGILQTLGCSPRPAVDAQQEPSWPYAGVARVDGIPATLRERPRFAGRWIASPPGTDLVLLESSDPRYMVRLSFDNPLAQQFIDLGLDVEVENIGFGDRGRTALLVAAARSSRYAQAVYARAILTVDLELTLLTDWISLSRLGVSRGMAVNDAFRRVFLLSDVGGGEGVLRMVDLYGGSPVRELAIGSIPAGVGRRGLAGDETGRLLFCLTGGAVSRSDFEPVRPQERESSGPELLVVSADTLGVEQRIALDPGLEPLAVAYLGTIDRVGILIGNRLKSRIVIVDPAFGSVRASLDLPEPVTDLVVGGPYGFCPGRTGVYVVDLERELLVGRSRFDFGFTGELAVSSDLTRAMIFFQRAGLGDVPGLAEVSLQSGETLKVLQ
jgi:hypothetical protein